MDIRSLHFSPLRLCLTKQASSKASPVRLVSLNGETIELEAAYDSSAASTPCSTTQLTAYGHDMNRDFAIMSKLEEILCREVDHAEVKNTIDEFSLMHGRQPTIRQLALAMGYLDDDNRPSDGNHQDQDPLRSGAGSPLLKDSLARRCMQNMGSPCNLQFAGHATQNPSSRASPSPSRFASVSPTRVLQPTEPLSLWSEEQYVGNPQLHCEELTGQQRTPPSSALRPFVPGLNLLGIKKRSPVARGSAAAPEAFTTAAGAALQAQQRPLDSSRGSPTEMLRMLLPSACKPRNGGATAALTMGTGAWQATTAVPPQRNDEWTEEVNGGRLDKFDQQRLRYTPCATPEKKKHAATPAAAQRAGKHGDADPHIGSQGFESSNHAVISPSDSAMQKDTPSKVAVPVRAGSVAMQPPIAVAPHAKRPGPAVLPLHPRPAVLDDIMAVSQRPRSRIIQRVPALALGGVAEGSSVAQPAGGRTRRLSITLPAAMVYGEGPLTMRRMAATATKGVASHALCTVFWADEEPEEITESSEVSSSEELSEVDEERQYESIVARGVLHDDYAAAQAAAEAAAHIFTAAAAAAAASGNATLPPYEAAGGRRGRRQRRQRKPAAYQYADEEDDPDLCGGGLMLPEELWDAWERLSDGHKSRQYRLLESLTNVERISCTSYSTVSKACFNGQPVVVKIYDVAERDKLANAFAEIGVLLHLAGWPGAVKLLDYGRHEDKVMLMLESCDHSLKDWCDSQRFEAATGPEYVIQCLRLWSRLAEFMAELHDHWHVAHCDLKPGNVLLSGGVLRLADFSESMLFNGAPLLQDQARGTVAYQPPEMVHGHCVDARKADVWAMGCILYELVTGELLFKGNSDCMRAVMRRSRGTKSNRSSRAGDGASSGRRSGRDRSERAWGSGSGATADVVAPEARGCTSWGGGSSAGGAVDVASSGGAVAAGPAPRVPRLPLGLARLSQGGQQQLSGRLTAAQHNHNGPVPPSARSAAPTGRSLELIAEGYSTEGCVSSRATDPWVACPSLDNTAPTTARSTARPDTARSRGGCGGGSLAYIGGMSGCGHYTAPHDTHRSLASNFSAASTAWPPPPPPSAGTARSVAASEWTLAASADLHSHVQPTAAAPIPPHARMRHSVGCQVVDPAGPDWLATDEADRMRIMADEPPSWAAAAVHAAGGRSLAGADGPSLADDLLGLLAWVLVEARGRPPMRQLAERAARVLERHGGPAAAEQTQELQQPQEPQQPQPVAALAAEGVQAEGVHARQGDGDALSDAESDAADSDVELAACVVPQVPLGRPPRPPPLALPRLQLGGLGLREPPRAPVAAPSAPMSAEGCASSEEDEEADSVRELGCVTSRGVGTTHNLLRLSAEQLAGAGGMGGSGGGLGFGALLSARGGASGLAGISIDGGVEQEGGSEGDGARAGASLCAPPSLWAGAARPVSLFELCAPLATSRGAGGRPVSQSWRRFLVPSDLQQQRP